MLHRYTRATPRLALLRLFALFAVCLLAGVASGQTVPAPPGFQALQYKPGADNQLLRNVFRGNVLVADFDRRRVEDPRVEGERIDWMDVFMGGLRSPLTNDPTETFPFAALYTHRTEVIREDVGVFSEETSFERNPTSLPAVFYGASAASDYDNDGDLDLLYLGATHDRPSFEPITLLYANDGAEDVRFSRVEADLPGLYYGSADWGDLDGDGLPDLLLTGLQQDGRFLTRIYRNLGPRGFEALDAGLDAVGFGTARWGDLDGDGDLDILLTGALEPGGFVTKIYRNDAGAAPGTASFTALDAGLPGLSFSDGRWFDYDSDGRLDVLLAGGFLNPFILEGTTVVYRNLGDGRFAETFAGEAALFDGDLAVGDYDNDGDLDFVVSGRPSALRNTTAWIYRNDGDTFRQAFLIDGTINAAFTFGDLDRDHDLELFMSGFNTDQLGLAPPKTQFYLNLLPANAPPEPPAGLQATLEGQAVTLSWNPAVDDRTLPAGLTYNVRVGTFPGGGDVLSAMAEADGLRWLSAPGNAGPGTYLRLNLPSGTYYWSVQALDASYAGSAFAAEQTFIATGNPNDQTPPATPQGVFVAAGDAAVVLSWTANNEPDLARYRIYRDTRPEPTTPVDTTDPTTPYFIDRDVVPGTTYFYRVTALDASGNESGFSTEVDAAPREVFVRHPNFLGTGTGSGPAAWGDYDNDDDLDVALPSRFSNQILRNDGDGFESLRVGQQLAFFSFDDGAGAWGDYDGDGDLDLLLTGNNFQSLPSTTLFRNDAGTFPQTDLTLLGVSDAALAWGDYDNDGDLDLALAGRAVTGDTALVYRNAGGTFTDVHAGLTGLSNGSLDRGDYDNDGDLDLLVTGRGRAQIFRNENGTFTDAQAGLAGVIGATGAWGDYDGDGDLDLVVVGRGEAFGEPSARVYRNENGRFTDIRAPLEGVTRGVAAWGDHDNDGDLDLALSGAGAAGAFARIYLNDRGRFLEAGITLPEITGDTAAWGDYDNDGDLDLLLSGDVPTGSRTLVFRNDAVRPNAAPAAPAGLIAEASGDAVTLRWQAAGDAETPTPGLTYNLRVGTAPGAADVLPAASDPASGLRRLPAPGNAYHNTTWRLAGLPAGTYFWSVQAVDAGYRGSAFAGEATFTIGSGKDGTATDAEAPPAPARAMLHTGYPNPFRERLTVRFAVPAVARVRLAVYDLLGRRVRTLVEGLQPPGEKTVAWDGTGDAGERLASGIYVYRLEIDGAPVQTRLATMIR